MSKLKLEKLFKENNDLVLNMNQLVSFDHEEDYNVKYGAENSYQAAPERMTNNQINLNFSNLIDINKSGDEVIEDNYNNDQNKRHSRANINEIPRMSLNIIDDINNSKKVSNGYETLRKILLANNSSNAKGNSEGNSEVTFKNQSNSLNKSEKESSPTKEESLHLIKNIKLTELIKIEEEKNEMESQFKEREGSDPPVFGSKVNSLAKESPRDSDISGLILNDSKPKISLSVSHNRQFTNMSSATSPAVNQMTEEDDILNTEWERILYEVDDEGNIIKDRRLEKDSNLSKRDIVMNARK